MPRDLTEEAVCGWIRAVSGCDIPAHNCRSCRDTARAVLALVREKVREAVFAARDDADETDGHVDAIVARVMKGAPRG